MRSSTKATLGTYLMLGGMVIAAAGGYFSADFGDLGIAWFLGSWFLGSVGIVTGSRLIAS